MFLLRKYYAPCPKPYRQIKVLGRGFGGEPFFRRVSPKVLLFILFLSGCAGNKIVLTYPDTPVTEVKQKILDRDVWVLKFGDQRKNSAVGLIRDGDIPEEWTKIKTDTPIAELVTRGVRHELIVAGYKIVGDEKSKLLVTGEVKKYEAHYINDEPPFVLAMAQLLVTVIAYDKEEDSFDLVFQEEFLAGAQEEETLVYSTDLFADSLTGALQKVCRKIAASKDLYAALRDYSEEPDQTDNLFLSDEQ
jgi:hypothetical protein